MPICRERSLPNNPRMDERPLSPNPRMDERPLPPNPPRSRKLQITLVSTTNLPGRRLPFLHPQPMKVYAEVSLITGDSLITLTETAGYVNNDGDTKWNLDLEVEPMTLPHPTPNQTSPQLIVKLSRRSMGSRIYIGRVNISVNTLHQNGLHSQTDESFEVEEIPNGKLKISYSFVETNQE